MADPVGDLRFSCHETDACPDVDLIASNFDEDMTPTSETLRLPECFKGDWNTYLNLKESMIDRYSRHASSDKYPTEDLRAAVMAQEHSPNFKMARADSTTEEEPTKTVSSSRARQTSSPDITRATRSTSYTTPTYTPNATPAHTTPFTNITETTTPVPTAQEDSLTATQIIGIGVGASIVGLFLLGCLVHRILVYIRKRRPGYPHLTDHAPDWHPPVSPVELTEVVAPGTRQCGFGRIPGEATRPSSWENKRNNEAEAKLGGVAPRRVKSEGPSGLLCASPESFQHGEEGQVYEHRAPLRVTNCRSTADPRSVRTVDPSASSIYERQGGQHQTEPSSHASSLCGVSTWVTDSQVTSHHSVYPSQGDYTVNIDPHSHNHHARPTHSADELRRYTVPYNPAARSDDQLNRFASYPAGEPRSALRSDGVGRVLSLGQCPLKTYEAYTPLDSEPTRPNTQTSNTGIQNAQKEVYELPAEPMGEVRDPRARVTLGDVYIVNPDPSHDEGIVSEAAKTEAQGEDGREAPVVGESNTENTIQGSVDNEPVVNITAGKDTDITLRESLEDQGNKEPVKGGTPNQIPLTTSRPESPVGALQAASILCSIATSTSAQKLNELTTPDTSASTPSAPTVPSPDDVPRLDATGGVPLPHLESSRPSSIFSTAQESHLSATGTPRRHSGIPSSSTAPTSLASQPPTENNGLRPEDVPPRMLAAPRRRASELHMDIPADDGLRNASRQRAVQLDRHKQYADHYISPPEYDHHNRPSGYGTRYPTYPVTQPCTQHRNTRQTGPYHPGPQQPSIPSQPQPHAQAHHTRVYYPHRTHPPRPMASPPASTTERSRRTAEQLRLGPQPRPVYRTPEGAAGLNRGIDIARRAAVPTTYQAGSYLRPGGRRYAAFSDGGYSGEYTGPSSPEVPRSEYFGPMDWDWGYGQGSTGSAQGSFSRQTWQN